MIKKGKEKGTRNKKDNWKSKRKKRRKEREKETKEEERTNQTKGKYNKIDEMQNWIQNQFWFTSEFQRK